MTDQGPSRSGLAEVADVLAELPEAVLVLDFTGTIVHANRMADELLPELATSHAPSLVTFASDPVSVIELVELWGRSSSRRPGTVELADGRRLRCDGWRLSSRPLVAVHVRRHEATLGGFQRLTDRVDADNLRQLSQRLETTVADLHASNQTLAATNDRLAHALDEVRQAEAFRDELLQALPVLLARLSPDHQLTYVSPNVERVLGVPEAEVRADGFLAERIHPEDLPVVQAALTRVAVHGTHERTEHRLCYPDGTCRWIASAYVPETADGQVTGIFAYGLDISQRRRAEQAQRQAQEEAEAANRAKDEFLSRMSHELRTPLNAVLGFAQLLEVDTLTDDQQDAVSHILRGGRHLLDLINEVLDISRIESGTLDLSPESVRVADLVRESVELIRPLAERNGIQIVVDSSADDDWYVFADRQRATQVVLNLLSNAVKYNRLGGTVTLSCEHPDDRTVRLDVADTGPGIPDDQLPRLFAPFDRLGAEQTPTEGTGIGLALSLRLAEAMDGTLDVASTIGKGSTFALELPAVEGPVERHERFDDGRPTTPSPTTTQRYAVLHVEDNLASAALVERIVARRGDIDIVAAAHGRLALDLARTHHPALVLLDRHLPDMDGEQVLQQLCDDPATASIPVVIVSADATPGQVQRLLTAGAAAYLTKPIDIAQMLEVIDEFLDVAHTTDGP